MHAIHLTIMVQLFWQTTCFQVWIENRLRVFLAIADHIEIHDLFRFQSKPIQFFSLLSKFSNQTYLEAQVRERETKKKKKMLQKKKRGVEQQSNPVLCSCSCAVGNLVSQFLISTTTTTKTNTTTKKIKGIYYLYSTIYFYYLFLDFYSVLLFNRYINCSFFISYSDQHLYIDLVDSDQFLLRFPL